MLTTKTPRHQDTKMKIEIRDPQDLRLHALHKKYIPEPDKGASRTGQEAEWHAFVDSIRAGGIIEPLIITPDGQVMSGGRRWRAAKQLQLVEIPCIVRSEESAALIIVETLLHRRQMTRGAAIYLALGLLKEFVEAAESRRLANLRRGTKTGENPLKLPKSQSGTSGTVDETVDELCARFGVSRTEFYRARQVREIFEKHADIKAEWEPKLLSGDKNLWNVLSAVGGAGADQSKRAEGVASSQLMLAFDPLEQQGKLWDTLTTDTRDKILDKWRATASKIPAKLRTAIIEILEEA